MILIIFSNIWGVDVMFCSKKNHVECISKKLREYEWNLLKKEIVVIF